MPRKPPPARKPTRDAVEAALRRRDFPAAVEAARALHAAAPTADSLALWRKTLTTAAGWAADHDQPALFKRFAADLEATGTPPAHLAALHARAGNLSLAVTLADDAGRTVVLGHAADRAVRRRSPDGLPDDLHAGFHAVLTAFGHYEAGKDDAAKAALEPVGLRSPFLEWKVLLRGLTAFSTGDDARAAENLGRLNPDRLPAKLAAPVRARVDAAFRAAQPAETQESLADQFRRAAGPGGVAEELKLLRADLSRDRPLAAAFRRAEALLPALRKQHPDAVPKLARCFYRGIQHHGEQTDLPKYRKLFGTPPDDPEFHRLEAMGWENSRRPEEANKHWAAFEAWLAGPPPGWPADLAARARAVVLHRMGTNALAAAESDAAGMGDLFEMFMNASRKPGKRTPPPDPVPLFRRAVELAPDWAEPAVVLVDRLIDSGKLADAEAVARSLLAANPSAVVVIPPLAVALTRAGRAADALAYRKQALAAHPLDKPTRVMTAYTYLAAARRALIDGDPETAAKTLAEGEPLCAAETTTGFFALRSVLARQAGRTDEADALQAQALAVPHGRVAALLFLAADSTLAKLKPAARKAADAALTRAWAAPAKPLEVALSYGAWDQYHLEGVEYRGQKAQEKKVHALAVASAADADAPEAEFETLVLNFSTRHEWTPGRKVADKLRTRFPANPAFALFLAEAEAAKANGRPTRKVATAIRLARRLAEASPEPRHKALLDRIAALEQEAMADEFDFF